MRISDNVAASQLSLWTDHPAEPVAHVRHSLRARRVAVRITAAGMVELVVPRGMSERRARAFLESRAEWVRHHVERRRQLAPPAESFPPARISLQLIGRTWAVFAAGGAGGPRLRECGQVLELRGAGTREQQRHVLRRWLARLAHAELRPMLEDAARQHGFRFTAMHVRSQRTRWGSCSTKGVISLNLALLFQSPEVVRYLLCHELAHTQHMNHSSRFWARVEACEPRWRELDAALCLGWRHVPTWVREPA